MALLLACWPYLLALTVGAAAGWYVQGRRASSNLAAAQLTASSARAAQVVAERDAAEAHTRAEALAGQLTRMQHSLSAVSAELDAVRSELVHALAPGEIRKRLQDDFGGKG